MVYDVSVTEEKGEILMPFIVFTSILIIVCALIFFVPAMNTYGWRIALFWYYFNGMISAKIYSIYLLNNEEVENMNRMICEDEVGAAEGVEVDECLRSLIEGKIIGTVIFTLVELYFCFEIHRYAATKKEDETDTSAAFCIKYPTFFACFPLKWHNLALWIIAVLQTLDAVGTAFGNGLAPMLLVAFGLFPVAIIAWMVVCRETCARQPSKTWRMMLFWAQIICRVIYCRLAYVFIIASTSEAWSLAWQRCM